MENSEEALVQKSANRPLLVAEGDSWFALPSTPFRRDVVEWLESFDYEVRSIADPSHTLKSMAFSPEQRNELTRSLIRVARQPSQVVPKAILLSGGGNDLVKRFSVLLNWFRPNMSIFRNDEVQDFMEDMKECYDELVGFITDECKRIFPLNAPIPILIHGYAHAVPDGRGFRFLGARVAGPWFDPRFEAKGHTDFQKNTDAMEGLVDQFNKMLSDFSDGLTHVYYVNMRNCLTNDLRGYRNDWADELHPTHIGFEGVAKEFRRQLEALGITASPQVLQA